ncbi:MAG: phosphoglycerate dehydrogenase [Deltaproteobacteria bacterium]|nr:phosphoglycerate dehydrogenase [Deltaproteobacteria bacterium]
MPKILISDKLSEAGLAILKKASGLEIDTKAGLKPDELKKIIGEYDGLVIRSGTKVTADLLSAATKLKIIGRAGIGVDNVDTVAASKKGIIVENTPGGNVVTTAEHAIAMMFAVARKIPQATGSMKAGKWEKTKFVGAELYNKTLGIVGVGNIGKIVADRAIGLKMKVIAYDPFLSKESASKMGVELVELSDLFARADFISTHTPLNDKTRNLIDKAAFSKMKKGVYLINCARGGIVNEDALVSAIQEGIVSGAALDVFEQEPINPENPLLKLDQVICTPHLGASTDEAQENVSVEVAEQMVEFFVNGVVKNAVNFPSISGELLGILQPYLSIAEKLGKVQGQLAETNPEEILIEYSGELANLPVAPLTVSILKGLLENLLTDMSVNFVNAPFIAKERGIKVTEAKLNEGKDFKNLIEITVKSSKGSRSVSGTIFGNKHARLVRIDNFYLEALPEGQILLVHNQDKPGVIGNLGSLLGKNNINISRLQLGLLKEKEEAIAFYNIDQVVSPEILKEISKLPNIISVKQLSL